MELYGFVYLEEALDALKELQKKQRRLIQEKIESLATNPFPPGQHRLVRGMSDGAENVYRIRSGDYRILYSVRPPTVVILDIGHRRDIYE